MKPPRGHATTTLSLKKIVRGLLGLMTGDCRLVFENTASCVSASMSSARSSARR